MTTVDSVFEPDELKPTSDDIIYARGMATKVLGPLMKDMSTLGTVKFFRGAAHVRSHVFETHVKHLILDLCGNRTYDRLMATQRLRQMLAVTEELDRLIIEHRDRAVT